MYNNLILRDHKIHLYIYKDLGYAIFNLLSFIESITYIHTKFNCQFPLPRLNVDVSRASTRDLGNVKSERLVIGSLHSHMSSY